MVLVFIRIFLDREKPQLHLALIYDEGTVWHFSMNRDRPLVEEKMLKLPKSNGYFGYSDDKGALYFIHSSINKPVTKFHKNLNKNGHKILPRSKRFDCKSCGIGFDDECIDFEYSNGILLGIGFWTFGKMPLAFSDNYFAKPEFIDTDIWKPKRDIWVKGPNILNRKQNGYHYEFSDFLDLCSIALNRTTIILVGGLFHDDNTGDPHLSCFFLVNVKSNNWIKYPNIPLHDFDSVDFAAVLSINKKRQR